MAQKIINIGDNGNSNTGDSIRNAFLATNSNFTELYTKYNGIIDNTKFDFFGLQNSPTAHGSNQIIAMSGDNTKLTARTITSLDNSIKITVNNDSTIDFKVLSTTPVSSDLIPKLSQSLNANSNTIGNLLDPGPSAVDHFNSVSVWPNTTIGSLAVTVNYALDNFIQATPSDITMPADAYGLKSFGTYTVSAMVVSNSGFIGQLGDNVSRNYGYFSYIDSPFITSSPNTSLNIDSGSTAPLNIGVGSNSKIITIGNNTGSTAISIKSGSGNISITSANNGDININNGAGNINFGTDSSAKTINIGNSTGATAISINSGFSGINMVGSVRIGASTGTEKLRVGGTVYGSKFTSYVTTGTPPLVVNSTTPVTNLSVYASNVVGTLSVSNGGTGTTDSTGTGELVYNNSPILIAPILGTPISGDLSNCDNFPTGNLTIPVVKRGDNNVTLDDTIDIKIGMLKSNPNKLGLVKVVNGVTTQYYDNWPIHALSTTVSSKIEQISVTIDNVSYGMTITLPETILDFYRYETNSITTVDVNNISMIVPIRTILGMNTPDPCSNRIAVLCILDGDTPRIGLTSWDNSTIYSQQTISASPIVSVATTAITVTVSPVPTSATTELSLTGLQNIFGKKQIPYNTLLTLSHTGSTDSITFAIGSPLDKDNTDDTYSVTFVSSSATLPSSINRSSISITGSASPTSVATSPNFILSNHNLDISNKPFRIMGVLDLSYNPNGTWATPTIYGSSTQALTKTLIDTHGVSNKTLTSYSEVFLGHTPAWANNLSIYITGVSTNGTSSPKINVYDNDTSPIVSNIKVSKTSSLTISSAYTLYVPLTYSATITTGDILSGYISIRYVGLISSIHSWVVSGTIGHTMSGSSYDNYTINGTISTNTKNLAICIGLNSSTFSAGNVTTVYTR